MTAAAPTPLDRISNWFFGPLPIDPLVVARIVLGAVLFGCYLNRFADVQFLYGPSGLAGPHWIHPDSAHAAWLHTFTGALPAPSAGIIRVLYALELVASLCFAIGYRTRTAGVIALLLHIFFVRVRLPLGYWGWSLMIMPLVACVIASRAGRFASVDAWLAKRAGRPDPDADAWVGVAWPVRLVQLHICSMYWVSGGERIDDLGWLEGAAIWYALSDSLYSKWVFNWHDFKLLMALGSWGTYVFEPFSAIFLWVPRVAPIVAYLAVAMHVGLEVLTNVGWWNFVMISGLLTFLPTEHVRALAARLPGAGALRR